MRLFICSLKKIIIPSCCLTCDVMLNIMAEVQSPLLKQKHESFYCESMLINGFSKAVNGSLPRSSSSFVATW